jgi:hypothetical protein
MNQRRDEGETSPKSYAGMTDAEFSRSIKDEFGYDPFRKKIVEQVGGDWLIREYKKGGKVTSRAALGVLAGIKRLYAGERDANGRQIDVVIPFDLLDVIGSALVGKVRWRREQARERADAAKIKYRQWQAAANEIWRVNPALTVARVAELLAVKFGEKADTIRKKIHKPEI